MSAAFKCDRCLKFVEPAKGDADVDVSTTTSVDSDGSRCQSGHEYELCVACSEALFNFLNNAPARVNPEAGL